MSVAVMLSVLALAALPLLWSVLQRGHGDVPARIVAVAGRRLPARLQEWGQAMAAELLQIPDRGDRWRFAVGVLRVALFPPVRHGRRVLVTAIRGAGCGRGRHRGCGRQGTVADGFRCDAGPTAGQLRHSGDRAIGVDRVDGAAGHRRCGRRGRGGGLDHRCGLDRGFHSAAITASSNLILFSVLFAVLLAGCLAVALSPPRGQHTAIVLGRDWAARWPAERSVPPRP